MKRLLALKGRAICELMPCRRTRESGIIVIDRKGISSKARVLSVGVPSRTIKGKPLLPPCKKNDIVYFKKYTPMVHDSSKSMKEGMVTIWWGDVFLVEKRGKE